MLASQDVSRLQVTCYVVLKSARFGVERQSMAIAPNVHDCRLLSCESNDNVLIKDRHLYLLPPYGLLRANRSKDRCEMHPNTNPKMTRFHSESNGTHLLRLSINKLLMYLVEVIGASSTIPPVFRKGK